MQTSIVTTWFKQKISEVFIKQGHLQPRCHAIDYK